MSREKGLTNRQLKFIDIYLATNDPLKASIQAGYNRSTKHSHQDNANSQLKRQEVQNEIRRRRATMEKKSIATAQDVMEFFTKAMNGDIKDQFGLEATLGDRLKAGVELAKRTVDIDNKLAGKTDPNINITLSWEDTEE